MNYDTGAMKTLANQQTTRINTKQQEQQKQKPQTIQEPNM